jgi:hypothetical protein
VNRYTVIIIRPNFGSGHYFEIRHIEANSAQEIADQARHIYEEILILQEHIIPTAGNFELKIQTTTS